MFPLGDGMGQYEDDSYLDHYQMDFSNFDVDMTSMPSDVNNNNNGNGDDNDEDTGHNMHLIQQLHYQQQQHQQQMQQQQQQMQQQQQRQQTQKSQDNSLSPGQSDQRFRQIQQQAQQRQQQHDERPDENMDDDEGAEIRTQGSTVIGAGPLPTSYGMQLASVTGSHLTEFTKRRNWSQRVIEELKDFLHILSPDGRILYASPSTKMLTGHEPDALTGGLIFEYLHPDDAAIFIREFNESISTGNPLRFFYRFRRPDNTYTIFESHGHPHLVSDMNGHQNPGPQIASACRGFFMMSRPYPTKNASLLDSFLEHKMENERLRKRIAELKREEREDLAGPPAPSTISHPNVPGLRPSESLDSTADSTTTNNSRTHSIPYNPAMPPPAKPIPSNQPLTQQNLSEALAASRPDSMHDKMARYEGVSHLETIEMLTGLRHRDGEFSNGVSTGALSPTLSVRGDAGVTSHRDKDGRAISQTAAGGLSAFDRDKKKKVKVADEYVCTDCGTLDSPEWRKGPTGPKTLCNACGLRWAKKEKRRTGNSVNGGGTTANVGTMSGSGTAGMSTPTQGPMGGHGMAHGGA